MRRPGQWLRTAAARVCAQQTLERVVDPIVADIQTEHEQALRERRWWRAAWICISGYSAFWKAVGLHSLHSIPRACGNAIAADGWMLGRVSIYSLVGSVSITLLLSAWPAIDLYSRVRNRLTLTLLLLPQAVPLSIPIAMSFGIVCTAYGAGLRARIRAVLVLAVVGTLLAFGTMLIVPVANDAFRVAMAQELDSRGITEYSLPKGMSDLSLSELAAGSIAYDARRLPETAGRFRRAYHIRFALPAATFVLSLLALGVCGTVRSRGVRVLALIVGVGFYYVTLLLAESKPSATLLQPFVSIWMPNVVLTAVSLVLLKVSSSR